MRTTIKPRNRILSLALALCLVLGMILYLPGPVVVSAAGVELGTAAHLTPDPDGTGEVPGNQVYFGEYNGDPILWRVLENNGGDALLFSESLLDQKGFKSVVNRWADAPIREYLNTELLEKLPDVLQSPGVIEPHNTTIAGHENTTDKLYLLSAEEASALDVDDRNIGVRWWLRTPGSYPFSSTGIVDRDGQVIPDNAPLSFVSSPFGVRPAFLLNLSSAIFTSAAAVGTKQNPWVVGETGDLLQSISLEEDQYIQIKIGAENTLWKVMEVSDGKAALLCTIALETAAFNDTGNIWALSDARAFLNPENEWDYEPGTFSFAAGEREAIKTVQITERGMTTNDTLFLLSGAEAENTDYFSGKNARNTTGHLDWWLRSAPNYPISVYCGTVSNTGSITYGGQLVSFAYCLRPAFRLNLSSVLFASAAEGGKSQAGVGDGLVIASVPTTKMKLTMRDGSIAKPALTFAGSTDGTGELRYSYTGATTGDHQFISCVLVSANTNKVEYYGKLADCETEASGIFSIPLDSVKDDTYTLKIFCEQANDNLQTDFAGESDDYKLVVSDGTGTVTGGNGSTDNTRPAVNSVDPGNGDADIAVDGSIVITFDKPMNTKDGVGEVALDNSIGVLSGGSWQGDKKTFAIPYANLAYSTQYTIEISGFQDMVGNEMEAVTSGYSFTTEDAPVAPAVTISPDEITLTLGELGNGVVVANANATNFSGSVTYSIAAPPDLPAGLEINASTGEIYVAAADALEVITTTIVNVQATDDTDTDTATLKITIVDAVPIGTAPTITTTSLPDGKVGDAYSETLAATGDTPITWIVSGSLPLGLSLSGNIISGTPEQAGTFGFAVKVENTHGEDTKALSIKITSDGSGETPGSGDGDGGEIPGPGDGDGGEAPGPGDGDGGEAPGPGDGDGGEIPDSPNFEPGGGSSDSRSSSSDRSGSRYTPAPKIQLPASAFSWDGRTLTIDHDRISALGLLSVQWDGKALTRGTDYGVYSGSVIVRFGEDFIAAQSLGDHTIRVEFLNHTGETTVTVGNTGTAGEETSDDLYDNETHNPNTGGQHDGSYPSTDNPNTGEGRGIWFALLLGSLSAAALVKLRPRLGVK